MEVAAERADLRHFEIFRHRPVIIYDRLPAGGAYYTICTFPASSECLISISDAFFAFCLRVSVILPTCSVYPQQKRAYSALHPQAWTYILGDSGGVVNSLDFCPASLKSLGCFYFRCILSSQWKAVTVNFRILYCQR